MMADAAFTFSPGALIAPGIDWLNTNLHPLFAAISITVEAVLTAVLAVLTVLPAGAFVALVALAAWALANWRVGLLAAGTLGFCWVMGLWTASMQTIALVLVAVAISVAIAFPLGILASRNKRVEQALRPVLDVMQTVPPWVYLIPAVIFFSLGPVPALIATVVYGVPRMLRLTTLALNQVPKPLLELGDALGATRSHSPVEDRAAHCQANAPCRPQPVHPAVAGDGGAGQPGRCRRPGGRGHARPGPHGARRGPAGRSLHRGGGTPARPAVARSPRPPDEEGTMTIEARIGIIGGNGWLGNAIAQAAVAARSVDPARLTL